MENIKVIIEIRSGILTAVYANTALSYILVDFDDIQEEGRLELDEMQPDIIQPDLHSIYGKNETGEKIAAKLKEHNF